AVDFLAAHSAVTEADVGAIGFCIGRRPGAVASCLTDRLAAAVPFYGAAPWPQASPDFTKTVAAFQGRCAEDDDWAVPVVAQRLEAELRRHGHKAEFFIYPGTQHAFSRRPAGVTDAGASALAWDRAVRFLKAELES
ncbi:MAG: dienelactone hydrolase family protein, partial [Acidimicrobiia bacterium]